MNIAEEVNSIGNAFWDGLQTILGNKLVGVYLNGQVAFPETAPTGDIDYHVILKDALTENEWSACKIARD